MGRSHPTDLPWLVNAGVAPLKGLPIYPFSYRHDPQKLAYRGVMAQDEMQSRPEAVVSDGEYMAVN